MRAILKHLVCDKGSQFWNDGFKAWCKRKGVKPRFGAVGQHRSIAVIERLILTLKTGCTRLLTIPFRREQFLRELVSFQDWYNEFRPHATLGGRTPNEVYHDRFPASRRPRFEPRACWPRGSPCARPWALLRGRPAAELELEVEFVGGRRYLLIVRLTRLA